MLLSKTCSYAIRASLYIAIHQDRKFIPIRDISEELGVSFHFLTKILQILTGRNILVSFRGPNGGITLARPAGEIVLAEIVEAVDGLAIFNNCVLGLGLCDDSNPCPVHGHWTNVRHGCRSFFDSTTLQFLVDQIKSKGLRLSEVFPGDTKRPHKTD
ncbi:MAG: Rrf2 family transcriptional regulator [Candidatus Latescibacterota bacterium]